MIGNFPTSYPDELLYSLLARLRDRLECSTYKLVEELFGEKGSVAIISLPCCLDHLISVLPPGHRYTVARLIDNHSLLPFYSPFLPPERVSHIRDCMKGGNASSVYNSSGIAPSNIRLPDWLRFCPSCVKADRKQFGEAYWHRLHQLTGVETCPIHQTFLENSNVRARNRVNHFEFVSAERAVHTTLPRPLDLFNPYKETLLKVANDALWLLSQPNLVPGFESLRNRYLKLLVECQIASENGTIRMNQLIEDFLNYYPPGFINLMQCNPQEKGRSPWLRQLIGHLSIGQADHPLRHLLLIQFLGKTAEEFFNSSSEFKPFNKSFGDGPWPCLDCTSEHFQELTISKCRVIHAVKDDKPIGIFRCACGFSYSRKGPDLSSQDRFRYERPTSYSQSWDTTLTALWEDSSLSLNKIAHRLGVGFNTVKNRAIYLGLPFPRLGSSTRSIKVDAPILVDAAARRTEFQENLRKYRQDWLSIREKNPEAKRSELWDRFYKVYGWLENHDSEWLKEHLPAPYKRVGSGRQKDWESQDIDLALAVLNVANDIKTASPPLRVTLKAIGIELDRLPMLQKERDKLPQTARVLDEVIETQLQFDIRRVGWAADCFRTEAVCPIRSEFLLKAGLGQRGTTYLSKKPKLLNAINTALKSLNSIG
ncbi:MAG TPA: TnsD family Tn7-like transposition protein [Allocoleopsis sp.]